MCPILKCPNTYNAATVTHSCPCEDLRKDKHQSNFCSLLQYVVSSGLLWLPVVLCSLIFAHLTVFLSFPVGQLPPIVTRCVCAGGVSTVLCGRPSWITQASCLAWIGIWFHFSLTSEAPSSAHFVSYHATSCWMHISKCASMSCRVRQQSFVDNARALLVLGNDFAVNLQGEKGRSSTCTVRSLSIWTVTHLILFLNFSKLDLKWDTENLVNEGTITLFSCTISSPSSWTV